MTLPEGRLEDVHIAGEERTEAYEDDKAGNYKRAASGLAIDSFGQMLARLSEEGLRWAYQRAIRIAYLGTVYVSPSLELKLGRPYRFENINECRINRPQQPNKLSNTDRQSLPFVIHLSPFTVPPTNIRIDDSWLTSLKLVSNPQNLDLCYDISGISVSFFSDGEWKTLDDIKVDASKMSTEYGVSVTDIPEIFDRLIFKFITSKVKIPLLDITVKLEQAALWLTLLSLGLSIWNLQTICVHFFGSKPVLDWSFIDIRQSQHQNNKIIWLFTTIIMLNFHISAILCPIVLFYIYIINFADKFATYNVAFLVVYLISYILICFYSLSNLKNWIYPSLKKFIANGRQGPIV